ncbi:MAG: hypothetical protein LQ340_000219 [Diploschistes diacapsis]|nr:MAG: hypothetical protein LQ340_000219 [Diploschistes diacapsis]
MASLVEARTRFLSTAARIYATTSPSTSAHLMAERLELCSSLDKKPKPDPAAACQACGTLLVTGLTSRKYTKSRQTSKETTAHDRTAAETSVKARSQGRKLQRGPLEKLLIEECLGCRRETVHPLPTKSRVRNARPYHTSEANMSSTVITESEKQTKRSASFRSRKKRQKGGLLAMAKAEDDKAKAERSLDLMDFMCAI